ncbi:hypothetical protein V2J09_019515 [Rumex salicifolius]
MMNIESSISVKDPKEKENNFTEVSDIERQLWASVHSKGLLNADAQSLYSKACGLYERLLRRNNEIEELQEIEYSLWKLNYKHIDEFRKQTSQTSEKEETDRHRNVLKGFKLFLTKSSAFYQILIGKIKRGYDFQNENLSSQVEQARLLKSRFLCHRLLVRVGDLSRYFELQVKPSIQQKNWSIAAKYYLEAAKMYPYGGNPHNQLAWLATYIGDEFLALYHCIRSLAVKEPFPDASNNLSVIFERNQSTQIDSLTSEAEFNFIKPSERVTLLTKLQASEGGCSVETDLWPLVVRMTGCFFLEYSVECFSYTFGSTIRAMEALLDHDDDTLSYTLESYQNVNLSRPGPYRALQFISALIFTIQELSKTPVIESMKLQMAFTVTFIIMGRVLERCLKGISIDKNPLLPSVLVFSEWLVEALDMVEKIELEEKLSCAMSYFFSSYVELLNRLADCFEASFVGHVVLWEDYELRGYNPISQCHSSLSFTDHQENKTDFRAQNEHRVHRIIQAAMKLANAESQRWIMYKKGGKFWMKEAKECPENEEEEDIVFKPITRHNSAPLHISPESSSPKEPSNEILRRASSLLIAQNRALISSLTSSTGPAPPSLNAWVFNDDTIGEKSILKAIDEVTTLDSLSCLSLDEEDRGFGLDRSVGDSSTSPHPHHNYCAPTPSAPLIPEDATWISRPTKASTIIHHSPHMLVPPTPPEWLLLRKDNQNLNWSNRMQQPQYFGSPWYGGNVYMKEASSRFDLVDGWGFPPTPIQPVYTECNPQINPMATPRLNGLYDQRREGVFFHHNNVMDARADQQQLLQYLKDKELRIQQDAQVMHSAYTSN